MQRVLRTPPRSAPAAAEETSPRPNPWWKRWLMATRSSRRRRRSRPRRMRCSPARWARAPRISARRCTRPISSNLSLRTYWGADRHAIGPFSLGCARELACEIANGFGVDLALVPFLDDGEIGAARLPVLASLRALAGKVIRRG